jgi:glycosyltransferase involved in cell wall biosynthesis
MTLTSTAIPESSATDNPADSNDLFIILIAHNVSEQMGGEAIKAIQIWKELARQGVPVHQVTHERVKPELDAKLPHLSASYVKDGFWQRFYWKSKILRPVVTLIFNYQAAKIARELARKHPNAVIHYTAPVSPVIPCFRTPEAPVLIGPINGNIHHPKSFRYRELASDKARRILFPIAQVFHRFLFRGKQSAEGILVAGGERTYASLRLAGCREKQFIDSLDSGIEERLAKLPRIEHRGRNLKFVHNGRLVGHKAADLIIKAMTRTRNPVELDVIGRGALRATCEKLVNELKLNDRVKLIEWIPDHSKLAEMMRQYRAFVFPSLAEANGIVVQEAMVLGLPVVCLDWGGPALLVTPETGIRIAPTDEETVVRELANAMDKLVEDDALAEKFSTLGRQRAIESGYIWPDLIAKWIDLYRRLLSERRAAQSSANR